MAVIWVREKNIRPQDIQFSKQELDKCFGKKMTREHFWNVFKQQYGYDKKGRRSEEKEGE